MKDETIVFVLITFLGILAIGGWSSSIYEHNKKSPNAIPDVAISRYYQAQIEEKDKTIEHLNKKLETPKESAVVKILIEIEDKRKENNVITFENQRSVYVDDDIFNIKNYSTPCPAYIPNHFLTPQELLEVKTSNKYDEFFLNFTEDQKNNEEYKYWHKAYLKRMEPYMIKNGGAR